MGVDRKIRYSINGRHYFLLVNFRKNSLGIKVNSLDMLELCYLEEFMVLEDMAYQLTAIHKIEKKRNNLGGRNFFRAIYSIAIEILVHMDFYIGAEVDLRTFEKLPKVAQKYLDFIKKNASNISRHTKKADIGVDIIADPANIIVDISSFNRGSEKSLNKFYYKKGKEILTYRENPENPYYHCYYRCKTIYKMVGGKEEFKINKLYFLNKKNEYTIKIRKKWSFYYDRLL